MKVICISVPCNAENNANIKEGKVYKVIETLPDGRVNGVFWYHLSVDHQYGYNVKYFIPLSEIDETELIKERELINA